MVRVHSRGAKAFRAASPAAISSEFSNPIAIQVAGIRSARLLAFVAQIVYFV
jgi:hypothetical protein